MATDLEDTTMKYAPAVEDEAVIFGIHTNKNHDPFSVGK
jgi:hypothetical protein